MSTSGKGRLETSFSQNSLLTTPRAAGCARKRGWSALLLGRLKKKKTQREALPPVPHSRPPSEEVQQQRGLGGQSGEAESSGSSEVLVTVPPGPYVPDWLRAEARGIDDNDEDGPQHAASLSASSCDNEDRGGGGGGGGGAHVPYVDVGQYFLAQKEDAAADFQLLAQVRVSVRDDTSCCHYPTPLPPTHTHVLHLELVSSPCERVGAIGEAKSCVREFRARMLLFWLCTQGVEGWMRVRIYTHTHTHQHTHTHTCVCVCTYREREREKRDIVYIVYICI